MRHYGSGTIVEYQTQQGPRYRAALPRLAGGGGERRFKTFATRSEAEQALAQATAAMATGEASAAQALTLGDYGARWLADCQHRSVDDDRSRWGRFVSKKPLAQLPLRSIKPGHIKRHMDSVTRMRKQVPVSGKLYARATSDEHVSAQTVRHVFGLLRRCFQEAIVDGHIAENPCLGYRLPKNPEKQRQNEARTFLTLEEIHAIETALIPERYRLIYLFAIYTGCREGELWALRWRDIAGLDTPRPVATVSASYKGPTKGNKMRKFHLLPMAATALRRWRNQAKRTAPGDLIFSGRGGQMHTKGYDAQWTSYQAEMGIREEVRFHDLRHTCASHLVMGSWGPRWQLHDVSKYLGHSSISVTQQYAHLSASHLSDLAAMTTGGPLCATT